MHAILAAVVGLSISPASQPVDARPSVTTIVERIRRADYEGDRALLDELHGELTPFVQDPLLSSRVLYWRGFARWRRALNGFNDGAPRPELEADLTQCVVDFRAALARDAAFVDAKAGAAACLVNLSFLFLTIDGHKSPRVQRAFEESMELMQDALDAAADNPRVLWVHGTNQWYGSPASGGGPAAALATYARALALARTIQKRPADPLEPSWGEAEVLMNLAFAHLNQKTPDVDAAERYAREALILVPYWHYVRDILHPQIQQARRHAR